MGETFCSDRCGSYELLHAYWKLESLASRTSLPCNAAKCYQSIYHWTHTTPSNVFSMHTNLQSVWPTALLALNSATFVSPICVSFIRKAEPVHFLCARFTRHRSILKVRHRNEVFCAHTATSHYRFSSSLEPLANHRTM
jgi:hypothetical protein